MPGKLIVNADGFGFTFGNNRGILECLEAGVVRSVSVNANFPAVEETPAMAERFPRVSVGVHLCLTAGRCVSDPADVPDLVHEDGSFLGNDFRPTVMAGRIPRDQLLRELRAQVQRLADMGVPLTHWDGHQNQHLLPPFFDAALRVVKEFGIGRMRTHRHYLFGVGGGRGVRAALHLLTHPRRAGYYAAERFLMRKARRRGMRMADRLITPGLLDGSRKFNRQFWVELFRRLPEGVSEIYCHPGYPDETLAAHATYVNERIEELKILRDPALAEEAVRAGVDLISFHDV